LNIEQVVTDLRNEKDRIDRAIAALLGTKSARPAKGRRGGGITSAGRRRLSLAMKRRWAARKMGSSSAAVGRARSAKRKGGMSSAARKRLSDAMKKRWAEGKMGRGKSRGRQDKAS